MCYRFFMIAAIVMMSVFGPLSLLFGWCLFSFWQPATEVLTQLRRALPTPLDPTLLHRLRGIFPVMPALLCSLLFLGDGIDHFYHIPSLLIVISGIAAITILALIAFVLALVLFRLVQFDAFQR